MVDIQRMPSKLDFFFVSVRISYSTPQALPLCPVVVSTNISFPPPIPSDNSPIVFKFSFPLFNRIDPHEWLHKCEQIFAFHSNLRINVYASHHSIWTLRPYNGLHVITLALRFFTEWIFNFMSIADLTRASSKTIIRYFLGSNKLQSS